MLPNLLLSAIVLYLASSFAQGSFDTRDSLNAFASYTDTIFLPWTSEFSSYSTPRVRGSINGKAFHFPVDTGSTGLMIGAPLLPSVHLEANNGNEYEPGWQFLSSNSLLYNGRLVPLDVTFPGVGGYWTVATVPVLVVQTVVKCPGYDASTGNGECPEGQAVESTASINRIAYMGVGFGQNSVESGTSLGTPDQNPFLNVVSINGRRTSALRTGYTVSRTGVYLGLTSRNTATAVWIDLQRGATDHPRDWAELDMAFDVNGAGNFQGKALVDTGVPQMFLQSAPIAPLPNVTFGKPGPSLESEYTERVASGAKLDFAFPSFETGLAGYDFTVGDTSFPSQPEYVQPVTGRRGPFVNTGRNFLFGFTIAFDADGGRFGLICPNCEYEVAEYPDDQGQEIAIL